VATALGLGGRDLVGGDFLLDVVAGTQAEREGGQGEQQKLDGHKVVIPPFRAGLFERRKAGKL